MIEKLQSKKSASETLTDKGFQIT
ncbi:uncharacterized protein METZ01_LOCUS289387 [marine metagenome]|uniref:Uncharacterized protein n=1 Tax=marine metagenome TaxID=408172 RepID=A0A382LJW0_9ZZZZ